MLKKVTLPPYSVRESSRAKRMQLKISSKGLEVVIPKGLNQDIIPEFIYSKQDWIKKKFKKYSRIRVEFCNKNSLPNTIDLLAVNKRYKVLYLNQLVSPMKILQTSDSTITIKGDITNKDKCRFLLTKWLRYKGRRFIVPWLKQVSHNTGLKFNRVQIKGQRSMWGSCSEEGNININYKILFFPHNVAYYIMIHELCHTLYFDHSKLFWREVERHIPDYKQTKMIISDFWRYVPQWLDQ